MDDELMTNIISILSKASDGMTEMAEAIVSIDSRLADIQTQMRSLEENDKNLHSFFSQMNVQILKVADAVNQLGYSERKQMEP